MKSLEISWKNLGNLSLEEKAEKQTIIYRFMRFAGGFNVETVGRDCLEFAVRRGNLEQAEQPAGAAEFLRESLGL